MCHAKGSVEEVLRGVASKIVSVEGFTPDEDDFVATKVSLFLRNQKASISTPQQVQQQSFADSEIQ
jgi:hypothetical protein